MLVNVIDGSVEPLERLKRALDASNVVGTFAWSHTKNTVVYDESAAELLTGDRSLAETEVAGDAAIAAVHPADREWLTDHMIRSADAGGLILAEYRVVSPRNGVRWLLSRGRTTFGQDGKPLSTDGILIDITETREAGSGYVARPLVPADDGLKDLEEIADLAILIRKRLDPATSPTLKMLVDLLLFQIGREIAGGMEADAV